MIFLNIVTGIPQFPSSPLQMLQTHLINTVAFFLQIPSQPQTKINILQPIIIIPRKSSQLLKLHFTTQQKRPGYSREKITLTLLNQIILETRMPNLFWLKVATIFIPDKLDPRMLHPRFFPIW